MAGFQAPGEAVLDVDVMASEAHKISREKGFWDEFEALVKFLYTAHSPDGVIGVSFIPFVRQMMIDQKLILIISEIIEAHDEIRSGNKTDEVRFNGEKPEGFGTELADAVIRIGDLVEATDVFLAERIIEKMSYNKTRPHKHGRRY